MIAKAGDSTIEFHLDPEDERRFAGRRFSIGSHGYVQTFEDGHVTLLHRVILGLSVGDGLIGDHIDGNRMNLRRSNLRAVTHRESSANVSARGTSGYRGVYPNRDRWQARCKVGGVIHNLGTYDTPEAAAAVSHAFRLGNLPGYVDRPGARSVASRVRTDA